MTRTVTTYQRRIPVTPRPIPGWTRSCRAARSSTTFPKGCTGSTPGCGRPRKEVHGAAAGAGEGPAQCGGSPRGARGSHGLPTPGTGVERFPQGRTGQPLTATGCELHGEVPPGAHGAATDGHRVRVARGGSPRGARGSPPALPAAVQRGGFPQGRTGQPFWRALKSRKSSVPPGAHGAATPALEKMARTQGSPRGARGSPITAGIFGTIVRFPQGRTGQPRGRGPLRARRQVPPGAHGAASLFLKASTKGRGSPRGARGSLYVNMATMLAGRFPQGRTGQPDPVAYELTIGPVPPGAHGAAPSGGITIIIPAPCAPPPLRRGDGTQDKPFGATLPAK